MSEPRFRRLYGIDLRALALSPEEDLLLSRMDRAQSPSELSALTGATLDEVARALTRLEGEGVIAVEPAAEPAVARSWVPREPEARGALDPLAALGDGPLDPDAGEPGPGSFDLLDPLAGIAGPDGEEPAEQATDDVEARWALPPGVTPLEPELLDGEAGSLPDGVTPLEEAAEPAEAHAVSRERPPHDPDPARIQPDSAPELEGGDEPSDALAPHEELNYRRLYEALKRDLDVGGRAHRARLAEDPELTALCLDPDPRVVATLLENDRFGLSHARLLARWHRNARGLELLARRADLLRDAQVQRGLLVNPQIPESLLRRLFGGRRLLDLFKLAVDRELPERTRTLSRGELRTRFNGVSEAEERADLVFKTEGRALLFLTGCTFDGRTTALLCSRTVSSTLLVQNLARFSATPPPLLAKLLQQAVVRHSPQLRQLLLRHPNMPSEGRRRG